MLYCKKCLSKFYILDHLVNHLQYHNCLEHERITKGFIHVWLEHICQIKTEYNIDKLAHAFKNLKIENYTDSLYLDNHNK